MSIQRFDVSYREHGPTVDIHFCREWDGDSGCYGTNPNHGMSFEDAAKVIAKWHVRQAAEWEKMTEEEFFKTDTVD